MTPVALAPDRQTLVALDQEDAGVADLSVSRLVEIEALHRLLLVLPGGGEPGTTRFGTANAAAIRGAVHAWFMEIEHGDSFVFG